MAKMRVHNKNRATRGRKVYTALWVGREHGTRKFRACLVLGSGSKSKRRVGDAWHCAAGHNPRKAIAAALKVAASKTAKRSGAFAGMK